MFFYDERAFAFEVGLPFLEELRLVDVKFSKIKLTPQLTPRLQKIFFQNVDDCDIEIVAPELREFSIFYYGPSEEEDWVNKMLAAATKLETFDSYKFRVSELHFASDRLKSIRLHRAELMQRVVVYAPNLKMLNVQAAYDLDDVVILDEHPNFPQIPLLEQSLFKIDITNGCMSDETKRLLKQHPRVKLVDNTEQW